MSLLGRQLVPMLGGKLGAGPGWMPIEFIGGVGGATTSGSITLSLHADAQPGDTAFWAGSYRNGQPASAGPSPGTWKTVYRRDGGNGNDFIDLRHKVIEEGETQYTTGIAESGDGSCVLAVFRNMADVAHLSHAYNVRNTLTAPSVEGLTDNLLICVWHSVLMNGDFATNIEGLEFAAYGRRGGNDATLMEYRILDADGPTGTYTTTGGDNSYRSASSQTFQWVGNE